jgi:hypothetical protein
MMQSRLPAVRTTAFSVLNTHPDGNNAHNMTVIHEQSVQCGMLQFHEAHVLRDAATTVLQRIYVQENLGSVAAVDVAEALENRTQITSPHYGVHNTILAKAKGLFNAGE